MVKQGSSIFIETERNIVTMISKSDSIATLIIEIFNKIKYRARWAISDGPLCVFAPGQLSELDS